MTGPEFKSVGDARLALGLFLAGLLYLGYRILHVFLPSIAWAVIFASLTWPIYRWLRARLGARPNLSALLMTLLLAAVFALPLLWIIVILPGEIVSAYAALVDLLSQGAAAVPERLLQLPGIGPEIERYLDLAASDPAALRARLLQWWKPWAEVLDLLGDIGRIAFRFGLALLTAFFLYRDGERLLGQGRLLALQLLGSRAEGYFEAIADTLRAVLYGLILTAFVQGALAGLGYAVAGVRAPVLLGVVTGFLALMPFGTTIAVGAVSASLLVTGELWAGAGLALWGGLVVSQIDNVLRPLLISSATQIPYLLVLFGVLGGLLAFGLVGLFLGPVVIAVLLAVWREWLQEQSVV